MTSDSPGRLHGPVLLTAAQAATRSAAIGPWLRARSRTEPGDRPGDQPASPAERLVISLEAYSPPIAAGLICLVYGALRHGVIPVVLDHASGPIELAELTQDADPIAVIATADDLAQALSGPVTSGDGANNDGAADGAGDIAGGELETVPLGRPMHYTSGTTGRRKGVFSDLLTREHATALWGEEQSAWGMTSADVHLVMSPLHHSAPLRFALVTLLAGGSVVLPGRFQPETFLRACEQFSPSTAFTAPAQLQRLQEHARRSAADRDAVSRALGGFRMLAHAGAPCPEPVKRWLLSLMGAERVWEFYGSTEGQFTICSGAEWLERTGSVGRARPGRELTVDDNGQIWCTVPDHARFSYWRDPEKTRSAWRATSSGSAFTVGDAGHLDEQGYLYLHGRRDDLIISGGVNVYPAEVERVLAELPGVEEVVVFGVPDDRWGQRVEAAIRGTADPAEVMAAAAATLAAARRPKRVHKLTELPRTSTGKILRRDLPELLA